MQSKKRLSRAGLWAVLLLFFAVVLTTGGVLARYVRANRQRAEMESAQFHISSNYLQEGDSAVYTVADWGGGFDILLYNYEKENIAQVSALAMSYTVTADNGAAVRVKTQDGATLTPDAQGVYPFAASGAAEHHVLHVTPRDDAKAGDAINITVTTTSPFKKTLTARFDIQNKRMPDYTVTDRGDGTVLVTIQTNDFEDSMTVTWEPSLFSPDNTSELMQDWTDANATKSFDTERNSTYELLFFKHTEDGYSKAPGSGTEITLN